MGSESLPHTTALCNLVVFAMLSTFEECIVNKQSLATSNLTHPAMNLCITTHFTLA
jgi:hypothetical protein